MKEHQPSRVRGQNKIDTHSVTLRDFRSRLDEQSQKLMVLNSDLFGLEEAFGDKMVTPELEPSGSLYHLEDELNKLRRALLRLEDNVTSLVSSFREQNP